MGHPLICNCGYVKLWHVDVQSSENSQHLIDWYTPSHIIHGFRYSIGCCGSTASSVPILRACGWSLAIGIEASLGDSREHADFIINRYRETTISLDYFGDSVINSVSDILFMVLGLFAGRAAAGLAHRRRSPIAIEVVRRLRDPRQPHAQHPDARLSERRHPAALAKRCGAELYRKQARSICSVLHVDGAGKAGSDRVPVQPQRCFHY